VITFDFDGRVFDMPENIPAAQQLSSIPCCFKRWDQGLIIQHLTDITG